ncbi:PepSY domain-containing protein [Crateriforma spongiae]|uniref:PepSY domain-containing protein n=1 Tax=Crateriforma spongiae TaxID=2724528 RepID=UPI0014462C89|nr:PepSY domain-containing protein [Crateriforma spongiae]
MSATLDNPPTRSTSPKVDCVVAEAQDNADQTPRRTPKRKTLGQKIGKSLVMGMRRVHLYSGIFMFPFVLLYGFSGWFFNHPRYFRDGEVTKFSVVPAKADGPGVVLPSADDLAEAVIEEMNLESFLYGGPEIMLSAEKRPAYSGFLTYTVNSDEATHDISVNPVTGTGEIRSTPVQAADDSKPAAKPNPMAAIQRAELSDNPMEEVRQAIPGLLDHLGLSSGEAFGGRRAPNLVFAAEADGVPCLVTYNLGNNSISSIRQDARPSMDTMNLMRRMHLARMYTPQMDIRWVWALVVDAMFVSMVFWGISGLFMWWQVKRTRWLGGGFLIASLVFTSVIVVGMHDNLTQGGSRRGGGGHGSSSAAATEHIATSHR